MMLSKFRTLLWIPLFKNEMITPLFLKNEGTYSVDTASTLFNLAADLTIDEAGELIEIVWTDDLPSWLQQERSSF